MKNYIVRKYKPDDYADWNAFISKAKNATFLFHRDFMEYHSDRFQDHSMIIQQDKKWIAVLPANVVGNEIFSHQGLTYGGLVYDNTIKLQKIIEVLKSVLSFLHSQHYEKLHLKAIPAIYCDFPSDELLYALFLADATLIRRDSLATINLQNNFKISGVRLRGAKKGIDQGLKIIEDKNFSDFWSEILIPNLNRKHNARPVHSLEEIKLLHSKFPDNIRQFNVYHNEKIVAGTTIFESKNVVHSQYIASNEDKNKLGSLDYLHHYLITEVFQDKRFFDFGISNENQGRKLNAGLSFWKESFGARTVVQDFYELQTAHYVKLEDCML